MMGGPPHDGAPPFVPFVKPNATRTEQGDLLFVLRASQGEFPRIVLAPGTVEECFHAGWRTFNLAEKYQCPVIVLVDTFLANSVRSMPRSDFHFEAVEIDRDC